MTRTSMRRPVLLLTAGLATLLVALALASTSASASDFCNGHIVNDHQTCFGANRTFQIVQGYGTSTSVCVGYNEIVRGACSAGPNQWAILNIGSYGYRTPRIIGNAASNTTVAGASAY